jgi:polar amino acid transport system substrate-binding protein
MIQRKTSILLLLLLSFSWPWTCNASDKIVYLTSLEWPPYAGKDLPEQGSSIALVREAYAAMGYRLEVTFFPWSRAMVLASDPTSQYSGYFPEYYSAEIGKNFIYSEAIGISLLGFAERKSHEVLWTNISDLRQYRIGVVQDYINTDEFDSMVLNRELMVSTTLNDTNNLKKLMSGRLDLAVIDKNVMEYLFKTDVSLREKSQLAQFNGKLLEQKKLYVCFNNSVQGRELNDILKQGLKKTSPDPKVK